MAKVEESSTMENIVSENQFFFFDSSENQNKFNRSQINEGVSNKSCLKGIQKKHLRFASSRMK